MTYRDFSPDLARAAYVRRITALRADPWGDMQNWARDDPKRALDRSRFVICGSQMSGEAREAARRLNVSAIVDDFRCGREDELFGIPIISTNQWLSMALSDRSLVSLLFVSTTAGYNHFMRCCAQHDLRYCGPLDYFRLVAENGETLRGAGQTFIYGLSFYKHAIEAFDDLMATAQCFEDEYSRFTYFSLLNYRLTGDPNYLSRIAIGHNKERIGFNTYAFNRSFFKFCDEEVFVDGGGFDGDSIDGFVKTVRGKFRHIYTFEPSPDLAEKCIRTSRKLNGLFPGEIADKVSVIKKGLWDSSTTLEFNPTLFADHEAAYVEPLPQSAHVIEAGITGHLYDPDVEKAGGFRIETTTIDEACLEPVSFIKLEIEGSELQALSGGSRTIVSRRPKMALSIYHKPEDLITLTRFVRETGLEYRMNLRQHNALVPDATVCYCS